MKKILFAAIISSLAFTAPQLAAKAEARKLLEQGKRPEAVKLINDSAAEIWNAAAKIMNL